MEITLTLYIKDKTTTQQVVSGLLQTAFSDYINSLKVGDLININTLNNIVFDTLATIGIGTQNIQSQEYSFLIDTVAAVPVDGYIPTEFDQYFTLTSFTLSLNLV